ncbi:hypothetical protein [Candidatus Phytoplasma sp. AldY-WA1]|uniref:hypothetical protein n=1 Tax=Candidatus Phytoplasma sp. AldY-WA1 TaxID=2852100 RepID=UPI00254A1EE1|nr:hypothetical protein [Candidatus Phytoplasma sp. AldY-WA1]
MTKRYLKFIYYFFLIIFLFFTYCYIYAKIANYFYQKKTHTIKMYTTQELKDKWLTTQPKLFIQNINVESRDDIPKIMKLLGIDDIIIDDINSNYNSSFNKHLSWNLKDPKDGLLGIYFQPRSNPFKTTYPYSHNEYTLDDLLTHKITIEKAYVFWDISKAPIDPNVGLHYINLNDPDYLEYLNYDINTPKEIKIKKYLNNLIKPYQDWLDQCEIKKDKKTLAVCNKLGLNETDAQKCLLFFKYFALQPFQVEIKPYRSDIENYEDKENDAIKNTQIFEAEKTKIDETDVYYINFNKCLDKIYQTDHNGNTITISYNEYHCNFDKIEMKFSCDVSSTHPSRLLINFINKNPTFQKYLTETIKTNDRDIKLGCYNAVFNGAINIPLKLYNDSYAKTVYFDDGVRVFTNYDGTNTLLKHANGAKNIYLFNFEIKKTIDLGILNNIETLIWFIKNNVQGTIIANNDYNSCPFHLINSNYNYDQKDPSVQWINDNVRDISYYGKDWEFVIRSTDAYSDYTYNFKFILKRNIDLFIDLGVVNNKQEMQTKTEEYINNSMPGYNKWNDKKWGYCTATSSDTYNNYTYTIKCHERKIITHDLGPVNSKQEMQIATEEWIKNNVQGKITSNDENWGNCTVESTESDYYYYKYIIKCHEREIITHDLGLVDDKQIATEEWIKNNLQNVNSYNDKDWGNCYIYTRYYKYIIKCREKETKLIPIDLGLVDNEEKTVSEWVKNNIQGTITFDDVRWGKRTVKSSDSNYKYIYIITCREKETKNIPIDLGPVDDVQVTIDEWIKNNVKGEIIRNKWYEERWDNYYVLSSDSNYKYLYKIKCRLKETIEKIIYLDPVNNKQEMQTKTEEYINNSMPGYNKWNDENWGNCTAKSTDTNYKYIYIIKCRLKEEKTIEKVLNPVNNKQEMQTVTEEWIKNNVQGEITSNDRDWGNCYVRSTDTKNNYLYKIKCHLKQEKTEIINLGPVNNMQTTTEEWIKNNIQGEIYYNDKNWGNCTVKFTDINYKYIYTIKCHLNEKTETIDLGPVNNMQTATEEWIKNNVQGMIAFNDKNWGNCTVESINPNYKYIYIIKCREKEKEEREEIINLGAVYNMRYSTEEWIKNNVQGTITYNDKDWGNCWVRSTDSNYNYLYRIKCHQKEISISPPKTIFSLFGW